jgi:hypothetical protein
MNRTTLLDAKIGKIGNLSDVTLSAKKRALHQLYAREPKLIEER